MNIIATIRPWHVELYRREMPLWDGDWRLVTDPQELEALVRKEKPRYVFFPHWSKKVPEWIWSSVECVCFHETPVPYGRGGSPIQNMIAAGYHETVITALQMTGELDAGPVYTQVPLSLRGLGEEIFIVAAYLIAGIIKRIAEFEPTPKPQNSMKEAVVFKRRTPEQSEISSGLGIFKLFDHIRMLDADEYPRAFLEYGGFRLEFSRPALRVGCIEADVRITEVSND